jgi:hypothetical protein
MALDSRLLALLICKINGWTLQPLGEYEKYFRKDEGFCFKRPGDEELHFETWADIIEEGLK